MRSRSTRTGAAALALTAVMSTTAMAQLGERAIPGVYAITNARIVPVSGPTLERGTVVIRDGLITAVGAGVSSPADARIIDGSGLTVYPGFIDAHSSLGIPRQSSGGGGRGGGGGPAQQAEDERIEAPNSLHPVGLQPELLALNVLDFGRDAFEGPRGAGITTVLTAPREGIFQGQSALINLGSGEPQDVLVRSPVALHVGFTPVRTGGYPGSLLGVFASLRQMLLDSQRYRDLQAAYSRNPRGMRRPEHDASLAALLPVLSRDMPVIMLADTRREIERALDLASEFGLRAYIAGGDEAWMIADRLKRENVPVIVSLNFPRPGASQPADADPEPLRVLRSRVETPRNPGRLATAGIRVAFTSGGMTGMGDFVPNVRKSVEEGMSRDQAIRALTLTPAELFGVADRLGSVEPGKIANLTVVRGDIFDASGRVTQVFVDGRPMTVRAPTRDSTSNAATGTWAITATLAEGERTITLQLRQEGEQLRGSIQGALGSAEISNGSVGEDGEMSFTVHVTLGQTSEEATFTGTLTGDVMRGSIQIVGQPNGTFVGTRPERGQGGGRPGRQRPPG